MRGLEVSRCSPFKDQLVQREIRDRKTQALVLFLQPLQFFELFYAISIVLLLPPVINLFSHTDLSDCINPGYALPHQNFILPQRHDYFFELGSLYGHCWSSAFLTIGVDQFKGGGSKLHSALGCRPPAHNITIPMD